MTADNKALLLGLAAILLWSTSATAFKLALREMDVLQLLFYAVSCSALVLTVIVWRQGKLGLLRDYLRANFLSFAVMGLVNPLLYYLILLRAYDLLPAQQAQPINYTWAIMLALLAVPLLGQKLSRRDVLAAILGYCGVVVIATEGRLTEMEFASLEGVVFALISTVIWALYWIFNAKNARDPIVCLCLNFLFAVPVALILCLLFSSTMLPGWRGFGAALYVGCFEMGITFALWSSALRLTSSVARMGNLIFLSPLISLVLIATVLGETIHPATLVGLALIIPGVLLADPAAGLRRTGVNGVPSHPPEDAVIELAADYYLHNFVALCQAVESQYHDLLAAPEHAFLQRFRALDRGAQCLYVRLISRAGPWFRVAKLDYPEIGDLARPVQSLLNTETAVEPGGLSLAELATLYTKVELQEAYGELLAGPKTGSKAELVDAIAQLSLEDEQHLALLAEAFPGIIIAPLDVEVVELLQILFFGNRHQDLTDFVLSDLGIARYYPYALNPEHRLFPCRDALDEYLGCCASQDIFYQFVELDDEEGVEDVARAMIEQDVRFPVSQRRWERVCNSAARELERRKQLTLAVQLYERSNRHPSRERRSRILEAQGDWQGAAALCEEILLSPWCEAEREAAQRILPRVQRKLGGQPVRAKKDVFQEFGLSLQRSSDSVELAAADALHQQWQSVHYVENGLMNTLFGLAFWQQIFADVAGAFHNQYQSVPRDMYERDFVARRSREINFRWRQLRRVNLREELISAYRRYFNYQCQWVDWQLVDETLLETALRAIPAPHLFAIWERQLFDPAENRSGFPDLIAFGAAAGDISPGDYCMIEVKGPGDALQNNQKRWLRYFSEHTIPAAVAWVDWQHD